MKKTVFVLLFIFLFIFCADLISATVTMDWAIVGDSENVSDNTGYGNVAYTYRISKYEVTNSQYCAFLNSVAATDPHQLYSSYMLSTTSGGIERNGTDGSYSYSVKTGFENRPVNYVSWYDSLRFANWLNNGQGSADTETGAYTFGRARKTSEYGHTWWEVSSRNHNAEVFLPSENEWYKAAFYKGGGTNVGYWDYATQSDTAPKGEWPIGGENSANWQSALGDYSAHFTQVGAYIYSPSPYGTFDQNGNVWEYNESIGVMYPNGDPEVFPRGGAWNCEVMSSYRGTKGAWGDFEEYGFRVASIIPEPCTLLLLGLGGLLIRNRK